MFVQRDWSIRLTEESKDWDYFCFVTLTYAPDKRPPCVTGIKYKGTDIPFYTLRINDCRVLLKYLRNKYRKTVNKNVPFTYFLCSEYGSKSFLPHYHMLLFFNDTRLCAWLRAYWQNHFGFAYFSRSRTRKDFFNCSLVRNSELSSIVRYVSKYCNKVDANLFFDGRGLCVEKCNKGFDFTCTDVSQIERPQRRMSRNIGLGYLAFSNKYDTIKELGKLSPCVAADASQGLNGLTYNIVKKNGTVKTVGLPRYYKRKLLYQFSTPELRTRVKRERTPFGDYEYNVVKEMCSVPIQTPTSNKISFGLRSKSNVRLARLQRAQEEKGMASKYVLRLLDNARIDDIKDREDEYRKRYVQEFNKSKF